MIPHSQPYIPEGTLPAIEALIRSGSLQSATALADVRQIFHEKFNQPDLFFTQSGTHALYWILKGLGFAPGDEVILPTYVCGSIYHAIELAGLKPVLCDVDQQWHMSLRTVRKKITPRTRGVILVSLFGVVIDCAPFRALGLVLINDVCQSFDGLRDKDRDNGDYAMFSFHPTKFVTAGNGGAFSILNKNIGFKNHLADDEIGFSICNVNLAILSQQLASYDDFVARRKQIAEIYFEMIDSEFTVSIPRDNNVYYRFPITQSEKPFDQVMDYFARNGVAVRRGVDSLLHQAVGLNDGAFPNALDRLTKTVSLPIYPALNLEDAKRIATLFNQLMGK